MQPDILACKMGNRKYRSKQKPERAKNLPFTMTCQNFSFFFLVNKFQFIIFKNIFYPRRGTFMYRQGNFFVYMLLSYPAFGQWPTKLVKPRFVNGDFDKPRNERFQRGLTKNFWTNRGLSVPKLTNPEGNISLWPNYWQTPTETLKWLNSLSELKF